MISRRLTAALGIAAGLAAAGCEEAETPTAPSAPGPRATVAFSSVRLEVREGEVAPLLVRYRVNDLAEDLTLAVSVREDTASADDYALAAASVGIPAARTPTSGERALQFSALADLLLAEGDETLTVGLALPAGVEGVVIGGDLAVTIREAGASPCPGVTARATPPAAADSPAGADSPAAADSAAEWVGITLDTEWRDEGLSGGFDFLGPFGKNRVTPFALPQLGLRLRRWEQETTGGALRHSQGLEWLASDGDLRLGFWSPDGACPGRPVVTCSMRGCSLDR